jgi:hypothetical protein
MTVYVSLYQKWLLSKECLPNYETNINGALR